MDSIKHEGSGQIFKNPILEKLTHTHIAVPLTIFYGTSLVLLGYSIIHNELKAWKLFMVYMGGVLLWTLFEYFFHRFVFHMDTSVEWRKKLQQTLHGIHHEFPRDKSRLAMPPMVSMLMATVLIVIFRTLFGPVGFPLAGGFLAGYASYLMVHYSVHAFRPPKNFFRYWWINHSIHHYKDDTVVFGVSSQLWDIVFRTMPREKY